MPHRKRKRKPSPECVLPKTLRASYRLWAGVGPYISLSRRPVPLSCAIWARNWHTRSSMLMRKRMHACLRASASAGENPHPGGDCFDAHHVISCIGARPAPGWARGLIRLGKAGVDGAGHGSEPTWSAWEADALATRPGPR